MNGGYEGPTQARRGTARVLGSNTGSECDGEGVREQHREGDGEGVREQHRERVSVMVRV